MYNIKLSEYIPEPCPATSDRIVAAHYYAAWKYGAAEVHEGFYDLAEEYPDRTPLMGYYDEDDPEVCDWEIKWAVEHGINCFIYCWYRRDYNAGKPITSADLRCGHGLHEALFNAKYQKHMKFAIMFEASERWAGTVKDAEGNAVCSIILDELEFVEMVDDIEIGDNPVTHYADTEFGRLYFLSEVYFYIEGIVEGDPWIGLTPRYFQLYGKNLDELITEYSNTN